MVSISKIIPHIISVLSFKSKIFKIRLTLTLVFYNCKTHLLYH